MRKLNNLLDRLKYLIFVPGLISNGESEIRVRIFTRLEQDPKLILLAVIDGFKRIISIRRDSAKIDGKKRLYTCITL